MSGRNEITVSDASTADIVRRGHYGERGAKGQHLSVEEALYLIEMRNAVCVRAGKELSFEEIAAAFSKSSKFMARYFTYKDWRDRGLVAVPSGRKYEKPQKPESKEYPSSSLKLPKESIHATFFQNDMISILDEQDKGRNLYDRFWIGQFGSYKAADRGSLNKLDVYETLMLIDAGDLSLRNATRAEVASLATGRRPDFMSLYEVYCDWRAKGYVVKTGFKFGTHFRVYFPGARPMGASDAEQTHSKHVIQVFPKDSRLLISEWARAIRVAHSVRKTFILALPGRAKSGKKEIDYILYHRHGGEADAPGRNPPAFAMLSLGEEEYLSGQELSNAISEASGKGLGLLLAIADRETAVTYYRVRRIKLKGSAHDYFEIDWMQP